MMRVVHAGDLLLLVIGWEVMGISSELLIGHHSERDSARGAGYPRRIDIGRTGRERLSSMDIAQAVPLALRALLSLVAGHTTDGNPIFDNQGMSALRAVGRNEKEGPWPDRHRLPARRAAVNRKSFVRNGTGPVVAGFTMGIVVTVIHL